MISRLLKVTLTEWKLFVTDPAAVLLLVVAGILYAFYYPTAYVNQTVTRVPVAVVDLSLLIYYNFTFLHFMIFEF